MTYRTFVTLKMVLFRFRMEAVLAVRDMMVGSSNAVHRIGEASAVVTRLNRHVRTIPAEAFTFRCAGLALGANHQVIAQFERTVVITAVAGTDSTAAFVLARGLSDNRTACDGNTTAVSISMVRFLSSCILLYLSACKNTKKNPTCEK